MRSEAELNELVESLLGRIETLGNLVKSLTEKNSKELTQIEDLRAKDGRRFDQILALEETLKGESVIWKSLQRRVWAVAALAFFAGLIPSLLRGVVQDLNTDVLATKAVEAERKAKSAADTADGYVNTVNGLRDRLNILDGRANNLDGKLSGQEVRQAQVAKDLQDVLTRVAELNMDSPSLKSIRENIENFKSLDFKALSHFTFHEEKFPGVKDPIVALRISTPLIVPRLEVWEYNPKTGYDGRLEIRAGHGDGHQNYARFEYKLVSRQDSNDVSYPKITFYNKFHEVTK